MRATDRCDDCAGHHPDEPPRFCSVCGRRLDAAAGHHPRHDADHDGVPSTPRALVVLLVVAIGLMLVGAVVALVLTLRDDDGGSGGATSSAASLPPPTVAPTAASRWVELAAGLGEGATVSEITEIDGTPTVVGIVEGAPTVWQHLADSWRAMEMPMGTVVDGIGSDGALVQLIDVTGDGHLDGVVTAAAPAGRYLAVLSDHDQGWRVVPFDDDSRWVQGVTVDGGHLVVEAACAAPCPTDVPSGPWFAYDDDGRRLVSTEVEPPVPLTTAEAERALADLEAAVLDEFGEDVPLDCDVPEVLVAGASLQCTLQVEDPRIVYVVVAEDGTLDHRIDRPFEML